MSGKERKPSTKTYVFLITYGILLYLGIQNFSAIKSVFSWAYAILQPISYGICIAFIINLFLRFFREKVFVGMANSHRLWERKLCPVISAVCTGLVAMILLALIIFMIIPQLTTAVNTLIEKLPSSQEQIYDFVKAKLTAWLVYFRVDLMMTEKVPMKTVSGWKSDLLPAYGGLSVTAATNTMSLQQTVQV